MDNLLVDALNCACQDYWNTYCTARTFITPCWLPGYSRIQSLFYEYTGDSYTSGHRYTNGDRYNGHRHDEREIIPRQAERSGEADDRRNKRYLLSASSLDQLDRRSYYGEGRQGGENYSRRSPGGSSGHSSGGGGGRNSPKRRAAPAMPLPPGMYTVQYTVQFVSKASTFWNGNYTKVY